MDTQTGKSRVLVVDDEKCIRATLKDFLEDEGCAVTTADSFAEAFLLLKVCDFDVAVIDRMLPNGHSGLDLIKHIHTANPLCRTILITAYPTFESAKDTLRNGGCDYLIKPVSRGDLVSAVKTALRANRHILLEKFASAH